MRKETESWKNKAIRERKYKNKFIETKLEIKFKDKWEYRHQMKKELEDR